jgi:NAD(P)-dependent dehydrogenase (short-subunit alcohol dehydrogenase family)
MTRSLAYHWARHGLNVNALAPGMVLTRGLTEEEFPFGDREDLPEMAERGIPTHRFAEADEMASIILFLCSPAARYINGASLIADGGQYLGPWIDFNDPEAAV